LTLDAVKAPTRSGWPGAAGTSLAVDISSTAVQRAAAAEAATDVAGSLAWERADLTTMPPAPGAFDLVSVQYFALAQQPDHMALRGLLDAVAPGDTLLFVNHGPADLTPRDGFDPRRLLPT
jgi:hypothetical protein